MSDQIENTTQPQSPEDNSPAADITGQAADYQPGQVLDQIAPVESVSLKIAVEAYLENLAAGGMKPGTAAVYGKNLDLALDYFGAERRIDSISLLQVGKFYACDAINKFSDGRPKAQPTVKQARRVFRQCLEYARLKGWISVLPVPKSEMEHARRKME